ncbi:MAG TPA: RNA polymerase sigma factor [Bacteroidia bacterium]|nr:RNA polymerase sigma factor [Bacteroidia bacterium]HRS59760.1 RNA polymerase sigma factor [Bacteroidia bacterium]HRU69237.1 RNA polymerase sigma factor [Bacteroidia bacterium]
MYSLLFLCRIKYYLTGVKYALSETESGYLPEKDDEEKRLIEYCLKNDRKAQKKLYEKYFGKMMATVRRYISDHDEAMEVVNNGFLKIYSNIHQYQGTGSFMGWMLRVMVNTSLDYLRANRNYLNNISLVDEFTHVEHVDLAVEDYEDVDVEKLYLMIDKLPPGSRAVFNLFAIEGFSHQEISEKLGISIGTSKAHLHFARKKLMEMLLKYKQQS